MRSLLILLSIVIPALPSTLIGQTDSSDAKRVRSPLSAQESLAHFQLLDGYRMQLVAAEPQVIDPVAIRFDHRGRMWVVEMRDYPHGPEPGKQPSSVIKILEDRDRDGYFETSQVFADQLLFATGVQPWRSGVIATIAGRVVYMPDDNDDGRADSMETWYEGFAQENSQLRANHPTLAIDNRVYVANGLRGGKVVDARKPESKPVSISGMDFRFHPLDGAFDAVSGVGQFGLTFDDDGRRFVCSNRNPLKHIVLPNRYVRRNPSVSASQVANDVAAAGAESRLYPLSRAWTTSTLHANQFTAACGVTIYGGDLNRSLRGNGFTCDPTGNLVHREVLRPQGGSFVGRPGREGVEFLASPDEWFRPVNLENGPEGALYVVDMYRAVIEHPQFVPAELKNRPDQRYGDDRGRIYRIVPREGAPPAAFDFATADAEGRIAALDSPNAWTRDTAQRLLLESHNEAQAELLKRVCHSSTPRAWARSLWLLHEIGKLDDALLIRSLQSGLPSVQIQALRLAEQRDEAALRSAMRALASSADSLVRHQAALSLTPASEADVAALAEIAWRAPADRWTRQAVALAAGGAHLERLADAVLGRLSETEGDLPSSPLQLATELTEEAARRAPQSDRLRRGIRAVSKHGSAQPLVTALLRGASRARVNYTQLRQADPQFARTLDVTLRHARQVASDPFRPAASKLAAIELLALTAAYDPPSREVLAEAARSQPLPQPVRIAALGALGSSAPKEVVAALLDEFPSESPAVRRAILDLALARSERIALLLDRVEDGRIKIGEIDRVRTNRLLKVSDKTLKPRIASAFAAAIPADRKQVLADYQPVLKLKADPKQGELIFRKNCASCHRIGQWGVDVAPDIADSRTRQPAQLLTDILQPNRAIDSNYISYSVITADGRSMTGVLDVETSDSITLKLAEGKRVTLQRGEIDEMRSNGVSLMPEGLEKNISKQEMADLISYIKNWRYLDGKTPYRSE